jgi:hypothetical protein
MTYLFEDYSLDAERRELRRRTDLISVERLWSIVWHLRYAKRHRRRHNLAYLALEEPSTHLLGNAVLFFQSPQSVLLREFQCRAPRNLPGGGRAENSGFFDREHGIFSS